MKKTVLALIVSIVLFSTVFISQMLGRASANPIRWWDLPPISYPSLVVFSPIGGESCDASNDIWLNFTVIKPPDWFTTPDCYIKDVAYCVDGTAIGHGTVSDNSHANQVIVEVNDPLGIADIASSFNFSYKLKGLGNGQHYLTFYVECYYKGGDCGTNTDIPRLPFSVYNSSAFVGERLLTTLVTASMGVGTVAFVVLLAHFKRRQRGQSP